MFVQQLLCSGRRGPVLIAAVSVIFIWSLLRYQWWESTSESRDSSKVLTGEIKPSKPHPSQSANLTISIDDEEAKDPCGDMIIPNPQKAKSKDITVLVTGGAGFIGSNLVDRLIELGYKVKIFDNLYTGYIRNVPLQDDQVDFFLGDILNEDDVQAVFEGVDFVFHMAAMSKVVPSVKDPGMAKFCVESNVLGSWNILNAAREQGKIKKVIYAASSTYYGNMPPPHQEDMAPDFITPYAASKYEGEIQMKMFDELFQVPTISTRFFMVYGPRQPSTGAYAIVTGVFAKQAADEEPLTIEGDGTHYRDFIHVSDIVEGLIIAQQSDLHGEVINLGSGTKFSVQDVANLVSENQIYVDPRLHDLNGTLADTCRMKNLLGYKTTKVFEKEMSYMAKETMKGNVFVQPWLTALHGLSAPHILPLGSPLLSWPKDNTDLDGLIQSLKTASKGLGGGSAAKRLVTVIPYDIAPTVDIELSADLLLNQIYSLVRFGKQGLYVVASYSEIALESCLFLNLPCFNATTLTEMEVIDKLFSLDYEVHYSELGSSYTRDVTQVLMQQYGGDLLASSATGEGDIFIRNNPKNKQQVADLLPAKSDTKSGSEELRARDLSTWKAVDVETMEEKSWRCLKTENVDARIMLADPAFNVTMADACTKPGAEADVYAFARCAKPGGESGFTNATIVDTIKSLGQNGGWHLTMCSNRERCDRQQTIPSRWVAQPADLDTSGGFCGRHI